jgi:TolA-binding protein
VHVRPQDAGERFLVMMRDGELEVRGTTFDVTVQGGETTRVRVQSGVVELRLRGRPVVRLVDGDAWTPSSAVSLLPPRAPASAGTVRAPPPAPADVDDGVSSYAAAMQRLRGAHYEKAAAAFHAFVAAWPRSSQAEDASFLEAVALARAGRPDAAGLAAERHLATFPASFHRKEAAILEARAAALRGECDSARTVLGPWLGPNPDADAVATLRGCAR